MNDAARLRNNTLAVHPNAQVAERGHKWIRHILPSGKDFILDVGQGQMHYQDDQGYSREIDDTLVVDGTEGYSVKTLQTPYLLRATDAGKRRLYPNRYDLSRYVEFSNLPALGVPQKGENFLQWNTTHAAARIEAQSGAIKFIFTLKDASAPKSISFNVTLTGLTRQGNLLLAGGVPVIKMRKPIAFDANETRRECTFTLTGNKVTISLDTSGLVFPIEIDPTLDLDMADIRFDAYCTYHDSGVQTVYNDTTTLRVGCYDANVYGYCSLVQFSQVPLPRGSAVNHAALGVRSHAALTGANCKTRFTGSLGTSGAWMGVDEWNTWFPTLLVTPHVHWANVPSFAANTWYEGHSATPTPDISAVVQAIAEFWQFTGQVGGNSMGVYWEDYEELSDNTAAGNYRRFQTMDYNAAYAPHLHIDYTPHVAVGQIF